MDTREIEQHLVDCRDFQGVFSRDTLPSSPRLLICNTDPSTKSGQHWIAICIDRDKRGEYFDPFGKPPDEHFKNYMDKHCRRWIFNRKQLQSVVSSFCGYYCCFYCRLKSGGLTMIGIIKIFSKDTGFNDLLVHNAVCNKR